MIRVRISSCQLCIYFKVFAKTTEATCIKPDSLGRKPDGIIKLMFAESKDGHGDTTKYLFIKLTISPRMQGAFKRTMSSLLTKKQDKKMKQNISNKRVTKIHPPKKLSVGDVSERLFLICDDCTAYPFDKRGETPLCKTCKDNPSLTAIVPNN